MPRSYWLVKTEPGAYSWDDLVGEGRTAWDGVRNAQARNNLAGMREGGNTPGPGYHNHSRCDCGCSNIQ